MEHLFVVVLFLSVIFLAFIVEKQSKRIREIDSLNLNKIDEYYEQQYKAAERGLREKLQLKEDSLEKEWQHAFQKHSMELSTLDNEIKKYESILKEKEARYNEINQDLDLYKQGKIKEIDNAAAEYERHKQLIIDNSINDYREIKTTDFIRELGKFASDIEEAKEEFETIKSELEVERRKRAAINEEIRREQLTQKEKDAHRIILSETDKEDIAFLTTIIPKLNHKEILYKLIWSEYLIKPYQNMIKQLFGGRIPKNVIYCIESLDGKQKYIGKTSADVSKRWSEHIKTSLNIGGVSRSKVHDALYLHWDEFTFSVIEETTKDQLSAREKYYINFFESDKYGLNIKSGG